MLEAYCVLAVERGHRRSSRSPTTSTSTPRCPPTASPRSRTGSATFARRPRAGRTAGLAIRFGVEVTYERRYEDEIRGWLRRHPHDYVIGSVHISAASPYKAGRVASFVAGRSLAGDRGALLRRGDRGGPRRGCSTRSATSTSSSATSSPTCCRRSWRPPRSCTSRSSPRWSRPGPPWRSTPPGLRQLPRETYPAAPIVERYRALGGAHVTIGSRMRTERSGSHMASGRRIVSCPPPATGRWRSGAGAERVAVPVPVRNPT